MNKKMGTSHRGSLTSKIDNIRIGETFVILVKNFTSTIKDIETKKIRGYIGRDIKYKRCQVIIGDVLHIGVAITRLEDPTDKELFPRGTV